MNEAMMTWRERAVRAREAGRFSAADIAAWRDATTCCVGEAVAALGITGGCENIEFERAWMKISGDDHGDAGPSMSTQAYFQICRRFPDFDEFERVLDVIEERALEYKRGNL